MRFGGSFGVAIVAVLCAGATTRMAAAAPQVCADADGNGHVTVSDGVNMLRAAAELSSTCVLQVCDVNLDGKITVSDGVIALREAAELQGASNCSAAQLSQVVQDVRAILETGIGIPGVSTSQISRDTLVCDGGGSLTVNGDRADYAGCIVGGFQYTGSFFIRQDPGGTITLVTTQFVIVDLSTGETDVLTGSLTVGLDSFDNPVVSSQLGITSTVLGAFSLALNQVTLDLSSGAITSGSVGIDVVNGQAGFSTFRSLQLQFFGPVVLADVALANGTTASVYVDSSPSNGVCTPCSSAADCADGLGCFTCSEECTGTTSRCSIQADQVLQCADGFF